jgi:hypothetical protein
MEIAKYDIIYSMSFKTTSAHNTVFVKGWGWFHSCTSIFILEMQRVILDT